MTTRYLKSCWKITLVLLDGDAFSTRLKALSISPPSNGFVFRKGFVFPPQEKRDGDFFEALTAGCERRNRDKKALTREEKINLQADEALQQLSPGSR
jgi:hypothetical protein